MGEARRRGTKEERVREGQVKMLKLAIKQYGGSRESLDAFIAKSFWSPSYVHCYNIILMKAWRRKVLRFCDKLGIPLPPEPKEKTDG